MNLKIGFGFILFAAAIHASATDHKTTNQNMSGDGSKASLVQQTSNTIRIINIEQSYTFKMPPKSSLTLVLNSTALQKDIVFIDYLSTFQFRSCLLNETTLCQHDKDIHKTHEGTLSLNSSKIVNGILFENYHETLYIKIEVRAYSIEQDCSVLVARQLYRKSLQKQLCFVHTIQQEQDLQILLEPESLIQLKYSFQICNIKTSMPSSDDNRFLFNASLIAQKCNGESLKQLIIRINSKPTNSQDNQTVTHILIVLEYPQEAVLLPDGVGYSTKITGSTPRIFLYELLNKISTTINVQSEQEVALYVKVVDQAFIEDTVPSQSNKDFDSKDVFVFMRYKPYIIITVDQLSKFNCQNCFLVISIALRNKKITSQTANIEVVQHSSTLSTGVTKHAFLSKNSIAYYKYVSDNAKMIYFEISDNNRYCTRVYFGKKENPSQSNHLIKYEKKQIIFSAQRDETYYLGLEAIENCAYSLVIYDSTRNITYLQKGRVGFLNLEEGKSKVYLIRADDSQYIKFISLQLYGNVDIFLNRTSLKSINNMKGYDFNFTAFQKKGQYNNILVLENEQKFFCKRCYYLVGVVARKHTQSSLFYGDQGSSIPIYDKIVNDYIPKKGMVVYGQYYGPKRSSIQLTVRSGSLKLGLQNRQQKYERNFSKSDDIYRDSFDLQIKNEGILDKLLHFLTQNPIEVQFQAQQDSTIYTLKLKDFQTTTQNDPEPSQKYRSVTIAAGAQQFQLITPEQKLGLSGFLRDKNERIIITSDYSDKGKLESLNIQGLLHNKKAQIKTQRAQNILSISFPTLTNYLMNAGIPFELSLSIKEQKLWVFIMQDEDFSILPPQVQVLVQDQYTFLTHAQSDLIIDIFQCSGRSKITYSSSIHGLNDTTQKELDLIGLSNQPHAVRINKHSTTFLKITAPKAIMRWFPVNIQDQIGTGYLDYEIGHLIFTSALNGLEISWASLQNIKKTNSVIQYISYHLFFSPSQEDLKASSQCQINNPNVFVKYDIVSSSKSLTLNTTHTYIIDRNLLPAKFHQVSLFVTIIADVSLTPDAFMDRNDSSERYRFFYPVVEVPVQSMMLSYIDKVNIMPKTQIIALVLLTIVVMTIVAYVCLKKMLPLLGILKNRYLIQEQVQENQQAGTEAHQGLTEVPASSDRRGIPNNQECIEKDQYIEVK